VQYEKTKTKNGNKFKRYIPAEVIQKAEKEGTTWGRVMKKRLTPEN